MRFQRDEIAAAALADPDEDQTLEAEEARLADASAHREAAGAALEALVGERGAVDALGSALALTKGRAPLAAIESRLRDAFADVDDIGQELRGCEETLEEDPARLAEVRARRNLLRELRRKYGSDLAEVIAFGEEVRSGSPTLESHDAAVARLEAERAAATDELAAAHRVIGETRRAAAAQASRPQSRSAFARWPCLAPDSRSPSAKSIPATTWCSCSAPIPGSRRFRSRRSHRAASCRGPCWRSGSFSPGRERSDGAGRSTLVFDEVDAGIGGEAALAVGQALAALSVARRVIVVTHLAQVAAFADHHVVVNKAEEGGRTVATAAVVTGDDRLRELSRMLSGQPDSSAARRHAEDLLRTARGRAA